MIYKVTLKNFSHILMSIKILKSEYGRVYITYRVTTRNYSHILLSIKILKSECRRKLEWRNYQNYCPHSRELGFSVPHNHPR